MGHFSQQPRANAQHPLALGHVFNDRCRIDVSRNSRKSTVLDDYRYLPL